MLFAFAALLVYQLVGEALVRWWHLPFPGALMGMLLLLISLLIYGRLPQALANTSQALLQNMMLLFIPTIAGVMLHGQRLSQEWLPFVVAGIAGAALTFLATAWTFRWMLAREARTAPSSPKVQP